MRRTAQAAYCLLVSWCLLWGLAGCGGEQRSAPLLNGTVDTFEDGRIENELGNAWEAISEGAGTRAQVALREGGYGESFFYLYLDGFRPEGASPAQVVGLRASIEQDPPAADPDRERVVSDVGAYTGLAFDMRGTPGTYIVQLGSALVTDFDYYNTYVEVAWDWQSYRVPFTEFRQEGFGAPQPWDPEFATHIAVYANLTGSFGFGIDNVRFYTE